jgi:hypothetical protein
VLDWFHPSMRVQHVAQAAKSSVVNGTLNRDHAVAEHCARRPFRRAA